MDRKSKQTLIAEEALMVEHSGEIPEVAYHSSLYYLTEDPEGPALRLDVNDTLLLKLAVAERYRTIILRDLKSQNRDKRIYRGLARCSVNWQRLLKFCTRENMEIETYRVEIAAGLQSFLQHELADVQSGRRSSCINCPVQEIEKLAGSLGLLKADLPEGWQVLCPIN